MLVVARGVGLLLPDVLPLLPVLAGLTVAGTFGGMGVLVGTGVDVATGPEGMAVLVGRGVKVGVGVAAAGAVAVAVAVAGVLFPPPTTWLVGVGLGL